MLQQTQVDRVLPKYLAFIKQYPNFAALAHAGTADVLRLWKGLGYNSRAVRLKQISQTVVGRFGGVMPNQEGALRSLPGIGPYTVAALRAFAFDLDDAAIDTNVRRVVHRVLHGVEHPPMVPLAQLDREAHELVPTGRGHDWNSALMDLGATLCTARAPKCLLCPMQSACAASPIDSPALERARLANARKRSPQEAIPFEKTTRYARGRIVDRLRELPAGQRISLLDLHRDVYAHTQRSREEIDAIVAALMRDGLVDLQGEQVALRD